ncbi:diaminopimelate epimerase [Listeria sp. PSOL-1]|uniref:diaminopimelate epimerase n=1 Tax=Listeria sp. PSOL-1 TaxID=1844999 RepID=UPI0013D6F56B|nr:diaminopimelate epimerase [Listeria sp. PSOL-1]
MEISFIKVHGSQNDFFIIDEIENKISFWDDDKRRKLARSLCQRDGLLSGADGVLYISSATTEEAINKMRVFNADGSEASMCGNGLRTVARYLLEKTKKTSARIETMKAVLEVKQSESLGYHIPTYQVEISPVYFALKALPFQYNAEQLINQPIPELDEKLAFSAVAVPNPHLITFVTKEVLESKKQENLANYLNQENPYFPDGVNVSFVQKLAKNAIFVRTYERGVGFTNACGTAMSAASLIKKIMDHDILEKELDVYNDGGRVRVSATQNRAGHYKLALIGNATFTARGIITLDSEFNYELLEMNPTEEQEAYDQMKTAVKQFLMENR